MLRKSFIVGALLLWLLPSLYATEATFSPKLEVEHFTTEAAELTAQAYIFEETVKSTLSRLSNISLVQGYQITNLSDKTDIPRYLKINSLHGLLKAKLYNSMDGIKLEITALNRAAAKNLLTVKVPTVGEGVSNITAALPAWLSEIFPPIPIKVVEKEEIERVTVGKFEYISPTFIALVGIKYSTVNLTAVSLYPYGFGATLDAAYRYSWFGFNVGGSFSLIGMSDLTVYAGPELNLFSGFITLTARAGYRQLGFNSNNATISLKAGAFYLSPVIQFNVTENYQITIGGLSSVSDDLTYLDYSFPLVIAFDDNSTNVYQGPFNMTGAFFRFNFGLTQSLFLDFEYSISLLMLPFYTMPPYIVESAIQAGLTYKFTWGGR